jgi:ATP/maltotriose-dependent transcriptional regulator MalT/DNA-binding SARP family transcriptional activator
MPHMPGPDASVDTPFGHSLSFAPPHLSRHVPAVHGRRLVAVGPGQAAEPFALGAAGDRMNGYPIQPAKVQRPPLRDETLARDRLLDWLAAKIHHRVILVLADAGYGKTTLLADFSQRTRLRTLWYRLDDEDRDWISFLSHLVAAGREHDPEFAPTTSAMLSDLATGGPTREAATTVFLRELPAIAEHGAVLILDDFHLVDESPEVRIIARELVARAPERLSIVFASRQTPPIPFARMRASGEVAELGTDDLRFDAAETARLFAETYGRELEPDVLADVTARTEGWAASLQLVQAALRDRSPAEIRRFVRGLTGADQELYDYLAEEVVGDLPDDLQQFLMRTSILQSVSPDLAAVVTGLDVDDTARLTAAAERLTLLTRPARTSRGPQRYHPLVREFLEARLRSTFGLPGVAELHRRAADAAAATDWRVAAYHYREAGDPAAVATTIAKAIPEIMGSGQHAAAVEEIDRIPTDARLPVLNLVNSRIQLQHREFDTAIALSLKVLEGVRPGSPESDYALLNLVTMYFQTARWDESRELVERLRDSTSSEQLRLIAVGSMLMIDANNGGSIDAMSRHLASMAESQRGSHPHFYGVTKLNLAINEVNQDRPESAAAHARDAIEALEGTSSRIELSAAYAALAHPLTLLGQLDEAHAALQRATTLDAIEPNLEAADLADSYTDPASAGQLLDALRINEETTAPLMFALQSAWFLGRRRRFEDAAAIYSKSEQIEGVFLSGETARRSTAAYLAIASGSELGHVLAIAARESARRQQATRWLRINELLMAFGGSPDEFGSTIMTIGTIAPWNLTHVADLISRRLDELDSAVLAVVGEAARLHPGRWRFVLRDCVDTAETGGGLAAARLLESIGENPDIQRLRSYAKRQRKLPGASQVGRKLARRLATRVEVEDQNRVSIKIGERHIQGSAIRRKVLALLCFLLTRPDMSSTRDQVLDALWPELDPPDALNSLNQTVYFLRRVVEENYVDDLSPGYLHHDSDLIWLDSELVVSRSNDCRRLMKALPPTPAPDQVHQLVESYRGRFALDFEYEEWAAPYRDWLHASYLEIVERAVNDDIETGHFDRGISLARRVLDVDPTAEHVEVSLLRLYRASGAHAAAAEQYSHYASSIREQLGVEPPPLESL